MDKVKIGQRVLIDRDLNYKTLTAIEPAFSHHGDSNFVLIPKFTAGKVLTQPDASGILFVKFDEVQAGNPSRLPRSVHTEAKVYLAWLLPHDGLREGDLRRKIERLELQSHIVASIPETVTQADESGIGKSGAVNQVYFDAGDNVVRVNAEKHIYDQTKGYGEDIEDGTILLRVYTIELMLKQGKADQRADFVLRQCLKLAAEHDVTGVTVWNMEIGD